MYGRIVVPQAVVNELMIGRAQGYEVPDPTEYTWMVVESTPVPAVLKLVTALGAGEAEALALSLSDTETLALLDDALARQLAASQGIRHTGTTGVLLQAKRLGLIPAVMPVVERIRQMGFRLDDALMTRIARAAGE